jgi:O-antigen/teichoic acid export membrane protein
MQLSASARKVFSGSALRVGNLIVGVLVALLLIPYIVHHLGDRLYGFWALAGSFVGYYGLLDLGLSAAVSQYICVAIGRNDESECRKIFNTAFRVQALIGAAALLVTLVLAAATPLIWRDPADAGMFWKVIVVLGVNAALLFPMKVFSGVLDAQMRFDIQAALDFLGTVLRTVLSVVVIYKGWGLLGLAWITLLSSVPTWVLQMWFARREASWARFENASFDLHKVKSLFSYSVFTSISSMADTLRFSLDSVVVTAFVGLAAVTHYRVAGVFSRYYIAIIIAVVYTFQPILSRLHGQQDHENLEKVYLFATKISTWFSVLICGGLIAWGKPFITRWMGAPYTDAYWPLVILTLAIFLDVCQSPSIVLLNSTFKHRSYAYINLTEGVINLVASLLLAGPLGIVGVALGTLIGAFIIRVIVQPWWTCKASGIPFAYYAKFLGGSVLRCGILIGVAIAASSWGFRPDYRFLGASAVATFTIYAIGSWWFVFNASERRRILGTLYRKGERKSQPTLVALTESEGSL